jgi:hypothetical protein
MKPRLDLTRSYFVNSSFLLKLWFPALSSAALTGAIQHLMFAFTHPLQRLLRPITTDLVGFPTKVHEPHWRKYKSKFFPESK